MEDDKLRDLFKGFDPGLTSDLSFMSRLERSMQSVELVRNQMAELKRYSRRAVAMAAMAGFVVGMLFSLALPYIGRAVADMQQTLQPGTLLRAIADNYQIATWIMIAATSTFIAVNTYELSMSLMHKKN